MKNNYSPNGKILWDSWFIKVKDEYHVFYLQAFSTKSPDDRHNNSVSIGHAISKDLIHWSELPTALEKGEKDAWDNLSLWTGSVIEKDNKYFMFYTGRNKNTKSRWIQKIGLAESTDLINWEKTPHNPILEAGVYYYIDNHKNKLNNIGAWRDPFVFQDNDLKRYYMTISAKDKKYGKEYNGCVALAESEDLMHWKILPPLFSPAIYDEIETTQLIYHKGFYYLFFSTQARNYNPAFASENDASGGLHCYYSKNLTGEYHPVNDDGVVLGNENVMYDIRLLRDKEDDFFAIGWLNKTEDCNFIGKLSLPFKFRITKNKVFEL